MGERFLATILSIVVISFAYNCSKTSKNDNNRTLLLATTALTSSSSSDTCDANTSTTTSTVTTTSATIDPNTGCLVGVNTCLDKALPSWIKDNFKCVVAYVSGNNYIIKTTNLPNTKSYYYTKYNGPTPSTTAPLYEALPSGNHPAGPNVIASQNLVFTIPSNPSFGSGTVSTLGGLIAAGVTVNGLAIFNNAAAPPDTLVAEAATFDNYQGHPQQAGIYHHHAAVPKVCEGGANTSNSGACSNSKLIGIALDGYPIYGSKNEDGSTPTLDSFHGMTGATKEFPQGTYHYRYAYDSTATIYTLLGSYFRGKIGSVTNN